MLHWLFELEGLTEGGIDEVFRFDLEASDLV